MCVCVCVRVSMQVRLGEMDVLRRLKAEAIQLVYDIEGQQGESEEE